MDVYEEVVRLRRSGQKCALATIVQVNGSIPSFQSAKLLVREDGIATSAQVEELARASGIRVARLPMPGHGELDFRLLRRAEGGG